jgi:hypothetical protein
LDLLIKISDEKIFQKQQSVCRFLNQDFKIIFTAMKYKEKYAVKNNIPNPNLIIL